MNETGLLRAIMLACSRGAVRLFRQNVGMGWTGDHVKFSRAGMAHVEPGDVLVRQARPLHAGLCEGSSDLIGWQSVVVTPAMVGSRLAVFVAIEGKSATGRASPQQKRFLQAVGQAGGVASVARSVVDAEEAFGRLSAE